MPKRKPPVRKLRPDRRVSFIVPPPLVAWINADLAEGWTITGIVHAALRAAYPGATVELPVRASVAPRNGPKEARNP